MQEFFNITSEKQLLDFVPTTLLERFCLQQVLLCRNFLGDIAQSSPPPFEKLMVRPFYVTVVLYRLYISKTFNLGNLIGQSQETQITQGTNKPFNRRHSPFVSTATDQSSEKRTNHSAKKPIGFKSGKYVPRPGNHRCFRYVAVTREDTKTPCLFGFVSASCIVFFFYQEKLSQMLNRRCK